MRRVVLGFLSLALWGGSIFFWIDYIRAEAVLEALGSASNADIYPIENRLLLGFVLGPLLSLAALIVAAIAGSARHK